MRAAHDLLRDILRTAHVTGLSREHQEAIGEALAALGGERASVAGMSSLLSVLSAVTDLRARARALADDLEALERDFPDMPRPLASRLTAAALAARQIGGPTDPTSP